ncbi:MAG: hypothetical protein ACLRX8_07545 [Alistipes sp.]
MSYRAGCHHRAADEFGTFDLLPLGENIHHVRSDLVALVPQHGVDMRWIVESVLIATIESPRSGNPT